MKVLKILIISLVLGFGILILTQKITYTSKVLHTQCSCEVGATKCCNTYYAIKIGFPFTSSIISEQPLENNLVPLIKDLNFWANLALYVLCVFLFLVLARGLFHKKLANT